MEGGSPIVEYLTYAIVGVVLFALAFLAFRTATFFLSLLMIPLTEAASRWPPAARAIARWGERGARRDPTTWRRPATARDATAVGSPGPTAPLLVRRGLAIGAAVGAVPGLWLAARGAVHAHAAGQSVAEIAAAVGIGLGLVAAAGALAGGAAGALLGAAAQQIRESAASRR